jgi:sulfonate transport system substrate-binding protein
MIKATKNRAPKSYVFPDADDITKLQKTADWLLAPKILPKRVDIAASVCPLGTTAAR